MSAIIISSWMAFEHEPFRQVRDLKKNLNRRIMFFLLGYLSKNNHVIQDKNNTNCVMIGLF